MELQIQDLVDSIKRDGIAEAEKKAAVIISEAKEKAAELVRAGAKDAAKLMEDAKKESNVLEQSAKAAIEQAGRDVMLSLKKNIQAQFDRLLEEKVSKSLTANDLVTLIVSVVKSGLIDPAKFAIEMHESDFKKLGASLQTDLAKELKAGLEIRPVNAVAVGFRLTSKDGSSYYDFSEEEIARMLAPFLNPVIQDILLPAKDAR